MTLAITVLLFGELRQLMGSQDTIQVPLLDHTEEEGENTTTATTTPSAVWVAACRTILAQKSSSLEMANTTTTRPLLVEELLECCLLAVNDEFVDKADASTRIRIANLESVALVPPVSGG